MYSQSEIELIKCIEDRNYKLLEIKNSKTYRRGLKAENFYENFRYYNILNILKFFKNRILVNRVDRKFPPLFPENKCKEEWESDLIRLQYEKNENRVVVYTCITNDYDTLNEPLIVPPKWDFIVFSEKEIKSIKWKFRPLPEESRLYGNNANRYIKMHPFDLFPKYDYAIYIDGNVKVVSDLHSYLWNIDPISGLAFHRHIRRNCLYDEAIVCRLFGKGNREYIKQQIERYRQEGMPVKYGLLEATVFSVNLKNNNAQSILNLWWEEYSKSRSGRDQISLPYVLWKKNITMANIGNMGNDLYFDPKICVLSHK